MPYLWDDNRRKTIITDILIWTNKASHQPNVQRTSAVHKPFLKFKADSHIQTCLFDPYIEEWWPWGEGALTLESGTGMCHSHDPFFLGQSALPSLPIYHQCAAHVPPPPFSISSKILHFQLCFGQNFSSQDAIFPNFRSQDPHFPRKICSLDPILEIPLWHMPIKKKLCAPLGRWPQCVFCYVLCFKHWVSLALWVLLKEIRVGDFFDFFLKIKKIGFIWFKSDFFYLNRFFWFFLFQPPNTTRSQPK